MLLSWFLAAWIGRRIRIWLLSAKCRVVEISGWGREYRGRSSVSWLAQALLGCQPLPPSLWLPRITMKSNVFLPWKNSHKPAEIFFPIAFCNIYPLFLPLSHSQVERMRHWQVTTVTPFNLLSLFKLLFQDYFIHLPFTLSCKFQFVSMLLVYRVFFLESIYKGSFKICSIWSFFLFEELLGCFLTSSPSPSRQWVARKEDKSKRINLRKEKEKKFWTRIQLEVI